MTIEALDEHSRMIYLEVPGAQVVLLQAFFESYEGIGIVRTLDIRRSLICVLTTPSMLPNCMALLESLTGQIAWRQIDKPEPLLAERYLGYFRYGSEQ